MDFLREVQQFQVAAFFAHGGERADQFADSRAVNVSYVTQVQQDLLLALAEYFADSVTQHHAAFAEGDASAQVQDSDPIDLSRAGLQAHLIAPLRPFPWRSCVLP